MDYDVIIIGAGPGGIFTAYELSQSGKGLKTAVFELGRPLSQRKCPIDGKKVKSCIKCPVCSIMSGFGGAGAFSDGKYNITNQFGGTLYEYIGKSEAIELMKYVDDINMRYGGEGTRLYSTANSDIKRTCLQNGLHLLDAQVIELKRLSRHCSSNREAVKAIDSIRSHSFFESFLSPGYRVCSDIPGITISRGLRRRLNSLLVTLLGLRQYGLIIFICRHVFKAR